MKQFVLTPAMGKRLIAKGIVKLPAMQAVMSKGILVIVAGTTNGYVAQEVLTALGQGNEFTPQGFRRGVITPPGFDVTTLKSPFPGDVVIIDGQWQQGKEIFDFVDQMKAGDVILKGGNALDLERGQAAVLIAHPMAGTAGAALPAVIGRRVRLIVPIGLEKRVYGELEVLAAAVNDPSAQGPRMCILPGEIFTELHAINILTGAHAELLAGGGVCGAEGSVWLGVTGSEKSVAAAELLIQGLATEPPCKP